LKEIEEISQLKKKEMKRKKKSNQSSYEEATGMKKKI
jgi:hypothetical protein